MGLRIGGKGILCKRQGWTFLFMMTGPSWQWSPTITICLAPSTKGTSASGSVACVLSSNSTCTQQQAGSQLSLRSCPGFRVLSQIPKPTPYKGEESQTGHTGPQGRPQLDSVNVAGVHEKLFATRRNRWHSLHPRARKSHPPQDCFFKAQQSHTVLAVYLPSSTQQEQRGNVHLAEPDV